MSEPETTERIAAVAKAIPEDEAQAKIAARRISETLATLEVSLGTYNEIKALLTDAGYAHTFLADGTIDMRGIGIIHEAMPDVVNVFINSKPYQIPYGDGEMSYQEIRDLAYPDSEFPKYPSCTWSVKSSGKSGMLTPRQSIMLENGLNITIVDTSNA